VCVEKVTSYATSDGCLPIPKTGATHLKLMFLNENCYYYNIIVVLASLLFQEVEVGR